MESPGSTTVPCRNCGTSNPRFSTSCSNCGASVVSRAESNLSADRVSGNRGSLPTSFWVATGGLVLGMIGLMLPWITKQTLTLSGVAVANVPVSISGFQLGVVTSLIFAFWSIAGFLIYLRLGYQSIAELLPSGPQREIPNLRLWMAIISL